MAIAFVHFFAELLIALILLRLAEAWAVGNLGADHSLSKLLAFVH